MRNDDVVSYRTILSNAWVRYNNRLDEQSVLAEVLCLHRGVVKKEVAVLCRRKEEGSLPSPRSGEKGSVAVLCRRKEEGSLPSPRSGEKGSVAVLCRRKEEGSLPSPRSGEKGSVAVLPLLSPQMNKEHGQCSLFPQFFPFTLVPPNVDMNHCSLFPQFFPFTIVPPNVDMNHKERADVGLGHRPARACERESEEGDRRLGSWSELGAKSHRCYSRERETETCRLCRCQSGLVVERLHIADIVRVSAVCGHWAWILGRSLRGYPPPPPNLLVHVDNSVPWMLLPSKHREEADYLSFQIINRLDKGIISLLPEMVGRRCIGSSPEGNWLVTLDLALEPRILNPLTRKEFRLPSLITIPTDNKPIFDGSDGSVLEFFDYRNGFSYPVNIFRDAFIRRVIITDAPPNCVAVAFYGFHSEDTWMALARPGDACWVPLPKARWFSFYFFMDAVYRQEDQSLYAVTCDGSVVVLNLTNFIKSSSLSPPAPKIFTTSLDHEIRNIRPLVKYLVFLDGELLQIWRTSRSYTTKGTRCGDEYNSPIVGIETRQIKVMRFEPGKRQRCDPQSCWVKVQDLGNYSLFIGCNHTLVVPVSENSELRPNCVNFTDDSHGQCDLVQQRKAWDVGVYDIKNGTIERFFPPDSDQQKNLKGSEGRLPTAGGFVETQQFSEMETTEAAKNKLSIYYSMLKMVNKPNRSHRQKIDIGISNFKKLTNENFHAGN
ncbi:hypothetical protein M5K25_013747 [Dendrobium thyrsiflorum]|uniref:KIB1-4 beta-propeller domain-containing protein n=1 Tax=Dendrobium thyrsiflorum TaxID=117978 RepID=A0ABD0UUH4_DENTH